VAIMGRRAPRSVVTRLESVVEEDGELHGRYADGFERVRSRALANSGQSQDHLSRSEHCEARLEQTLGKAAFYACFL
jgi:hypothetical protein